MNRKSHPYDEYFEYLMPAIKSKVEELKFFGYDDITEDNLWEYLTKKKWKKPQEGIRTYQLVGDIISVKPGEFMNFATVQAYRSPDWFGDLNGEEWKDLLHPKKPN
ncbi:MAG TPA: post-transcriptional regulator [Chondromyces sp.]|nr:post-transcriptional regulator [Chondromyces sp.]